MVIKQKLVKKLLIFDFELFKATLSFYFLHKFKKSETVYQGE